MVVQFPITPNLSCGRRRFLYAQRMKSTSNSACYTYVYIRTCTYAVGVGDRRGDSSQFTISPCKRMWIAGVCPQMHPRVCITHKQTPSHTIQPTHRPNRERGPEWLSSDWNTNPRPHHTPSTPSSRPTDQIGSAGRIGFLRIGIPIRDHTTPFDMRIIPN